MYKVNMENHSMTQVEQICLRDAQLMERYDLQEWIAKNPECLGEPLLVIQKEFSAWGERADRRLDLLLLDKQGNLVIVENKRDDSGREVVAQALTYASFCKTMTKARILDEFRQYQLANGVAENAIDAEERICNFLDEDQIDDVSLNAGQQRIILVAGDYPIEVTSSVLWLREFNVDISCVRYSVYRDGEQVFADFDKIIPTPGMEQFQIRMAERHAEDVANGENARRCNPEYRAYWVAVNEYLRQNGDILNAGFSPSDAWANSGKQWYHFRISGKAYGMGLRLYQSKGQVGVYVAVDTREQSGEAFYRQMENVRDQINATIGVDAVSPVKWGANDERTVAAVFTWDRECPENSIRWQFERLIALKAVLDQLRP